VVLVIIKDVAIITSSRDLRHFLFSIWIRVVAVDVGLFLESLELLTGDG
jgi:hypothetical protein